MDCASSIIEARKKAWKNGGYVLVTILSMILTILIIRMSYKLTNASRNVIEVDGSEEMLVVYGVVVVIFGMLYFIYGFIILIELGLALFAWLHGKGVENCKNQGNEDEKSRCNKLCIQATATMVSMSMLGWAIYNGCKLATTTTPQNKGIRNCMLFLVGFTGMSLGFICFIFGIPFLVEPLLSLYDQFLHNNNVTQSDIHYEKITDPFLDV